MLVLTVVLLMIAVGGALLWRRDKLVFGVFVGAGVAAAIAVRSGTGDQVVSFAALLVALSAAGMIVYTVLRWPPLRLAPLWCCVGGIANTVLSPLLVRWLGVATVEQQGDWLVALGPVSLLGALIVAMGAWLVRLAVHAVGGPAEVSSAGTTASPEDRRAVLKMVADGKVSADEASELLKALSPESPPGDRLPVTAGILTSLLAGIAVVIGFMLPWGYVRMGGMEGYQAGYHVGFLGWLILTLGLLPAVLACVPALDKCLRQGLLRLLLACTGGVFAVSLLITAVAKGASPPIGIIVVLLGFGVHLLAALADSGVLRPQSSAA